jgi:hypothetical protein
MDSASDQSIPLRHRGGPASKNITYICQLTIITIVVIACIINLSLKNGNTELWVSFLSLGIGFVIPHPKVKTVKPITPS